MKNNGIALQFRDADGVSIGSPPLYGVPEAAMADETDLLGDTLICFSHLRWDFVFQRPQHLMQRFAAKMRVFFYEEPVPVWEPAVTAEGAEPRLSLTSTPEGVTVIRPLLPAGTDGAAALRLQAKLLQAFLREQGIERPVLWFYTPFLLGITERVERRLTVYDCMDELSAFRFAPQNMLQRERAMMRRADLVFTGGVSLYEAKRTLHPDVHAFPSAVDIAHFLPARTKLPEPADQKDIPRPRLGFFGVLDERLDQALLAAIADARPDWQIVMVGPVVKIDPAALPQRPNIHYLGQKTYQALPSYLAGWDVALMPFARNDATRFISPTKTPEYLAAGRPVVSTPIKDVVKTYGGLDAVRIAATPEAFVAEAETARQLAARPEAWLPAVDHVLADMSWDQTWDKMTRLMAEAVARRRPAPRSEDLQMARMA